MDSKNIYELLEKYWACETNIEEENALKRFFASGDVPAELASYKDWFVETNRSVEPLDDAFDERLLAQISTGKKSRTIRPRFTLRRWMHVAAMLAIVFTCALFIRNYQSSNQPVSLAIMEDTYDNPEDALAAVRNVLYYASEEINKGLDISASGFQKAAPALNIINVK